MGHSDLLEEQGGEQAVKGEITMQVTMEKQVFLRYMPRLFPGLSNLWKVHGFPS